MTPFRRCFILAAALLLSAAQVTWAQVLIQEIDNADDLVEAVKNNGKMIKLTGDITLDRYLNIDAGYTIFLNLNGHKLSRSITGSHSNTGHVIYVHNNSRLELTNSTGTGSIEGGKASNGGAIFIEPGSTVIASDVTFQNNSASEQAGAIWNSGTLDATRCSFIGNTANDVGGVYNAVVQSDIFGTATFTECTFTGNTGTAGCGALGNAAGNTAGKALMTLDNCTISNNTAGTNGGGVWNGGTLTIIGGTISDNTCDGSYNGGGIFQAAGELEMSGNPVVKNNRKGTSTTNNLYLTESKKVTVAGAFTTGAEIGLSAAYMDATLTSGFSSKNPSAAANDFFFADNAARYDLFLIDGEIVGGVAADYLNLDGKIVTREGCRRLSSFTRSASLSSGWYVVDETTVTFSKRIEISGTVNIILADNTLLEAKEGIHVPEEATLNIWAQRSGHGEGTGELKANVKSGTGANSLANKQNVAGIGENRQALDIVGEPNGAINFHGGVVAAIGGDNAPGIGGYNGKDITITEGSVFAVGGENAAGIGCGYYGISPKNITITGGKVTALGIVGGAGIGTGRFGYNHVPKGGSSAVPDADGLHTIRITGGNVTATGAGAGIGGGDGGRNGYDGCAGNVFIEGGTVNASTLNPATEQIYFNSRAQAIGHGNVDSSGSGHSGFYMDGVFTVYSNAKVVAKRYYGNSETTVAAAIRTTAFRWAEVTISPCDHPGLHEGDVCPYCGSTGLSLSDASDNSSVISSHHNMLMDVTIAGRTLFKDGSWNTISLPFALTSLAGTPLEGATVRTLSGASVSDGVLTLTFGETATAIQAGRPYIVKWDEGVDITDPIFKGVTVNNTIGTIEKNGVKFSATYKPHTLGAGDTGLFLGADNQLFHATTDLNVNAFRGYFLLKNGTQPNAVRSVVMDFGETPETEAISPDND